MLSDGLHVLSCLGDPIPHDPHDTTLARSTACTLAARSQHIVSFGSLGRDQQLRQCGEYNSQDKTLGEPRTRNQPPPSR